MLLASLAAPLAEFARADDAIVPDMFPTIGEAIANATDADRDGVVEIRVRRGTYNEDLIIRRSNLRITGDDRDTTVIRGSGLTDALRIESASSVEVRNLTVTGGGSGGDGIELARSSGCRIEDCLVTGNKRGITMSRSPGNVVTLCEVTGNSNVGVKVAQASNGVLVRSNFVSMNGSHGIDVVVSDSVTVLDNESVDNIGNGIRVGVASFCQASGNLCQFNGQNGLLTGRGSEDVFLENECSGNVENGIRLIETHQFTVSGNTFTNNHNFGIRRRLWDHDDYDAGAPNVQLPPGANDVSGNDDGGVRNDL